MASKHYTEVMENGFTVFEQWINKIDLYELAYGKAAWDYPTHGHDTNGVYYKYGVGGVAWANYWTAPLNDHHIIKKIREKTDLIASEFFDEPVFYHCDCSVLTPKCNMLRPHVDTPHRHAPWNNDQRMLGLQFAMPINEFVPNGQSGTTAFLPGSNKKTWNIKSCYGGKYTSEFILGADQPEVHYGDIIVWDAKTLHSQMPNVSDSNRYMLLMNYLDESVVHDVMEYEASLRLS